MGDACGPFQKSEAKTCFELLSASRAQILAFLFLWPRAWNHGSEGNVP